MPNDSSDRELLLRVAYNYLQQGNAAEAERYCRTTLQAAPAHVDALSILGLALIAQSRASETAGVYKELTRRQPDVNSHWMNLGTALRALRRHDEALTAYAQAAALGERSADFFYNAGLLHMERGDYETARRVLDEAAQLAPRDAQIRIQYAQCCYESLHVEAAVEALSTWPTLEDLDSERLAAIALLLLNLGEIRSADSAARRAAADPTPSPSALLRLAQFYERSNRLAPARENLQRLQARPDAATLGEDLQLLEAQLAQREGRHEEASRLFSALAAGCREEHRRHLYLFPLAKSLDALKRPDEAYDRLVEAHAAQMLQLSRTNPDAAGLREPPMLITRHGCDPADIACWDESDAPAADQSPVFIVAFPRSGTTLLEQTLDAHPLLVTMDEQPYLQHAIDRIEDFGVHYPAGLAHLTGAQLADARAHYWSLTRRKVTLAPGQRLLDKNPLNLLRLPAIRRLFPHAPVVLAIRHPCDVVLSCFMQHFRAPEFALLCHDLPTLARGYRRAFDFWYQQLPLLRPAVHEIRYEEFVTHFETQLRALCDFLQLPWHEAMLAPGEHARARGFISTPSYSQVIEPVNRRSVDRWKPYARHFGEALPELAPYLARWGYSA